MDWETLAISGIIRREKREAAEEEELEEVGGGEDNDVVEGVSSSIGTLASVTSLEEEGAEEGERVEEEEEEGRMVGKGSAESEDAKNERVGASRREVRVSSGKTCCWWRGMEEGKGREEEVDWEEMSSSIGVAGSEDPEAG